MFIYRTSRCNIHRRTREFNEDFLDLKKFIPTNLTYVKAFAYERSMTGQDPIYT